jgi:peptidoglycan/LPS O-acetylase OafA/YrhL
MINARSMHRINKLDGLRGLFAFFVVLFHFNKHNAPQFIVDNFFVRESYIFVDFFFILSGYVITLTYNERLNNGADFLTFIKKRFIRLYPLLLFSTLIYWGFVHPHFNNQNIWLALDTLLLTNATPLISSGIGMNYPSWSISSEMISYILFGFSSIIAIQKRKPVLLAILTIGSFFLLASQQNYFQTGTFGFVRGLACFNLGYFIYIIAAKKIHLPNQTEWIVLIAIIALMYYHYIVSIDNQMGMILLQFLIPIAFATCILVLIKTNGYLSQLLQTKPCLFLGKISYSVYLNHAFVIGYFIPKLFRWIQFMNGETKKTISIGILLIVLVLYSWATQHFIENKLGKKIATFLKA